MRCHEARLVLELASTGTVTPAQQIELEQHLTVCQPCREEAVRAYNVKANIESDSEFCPGETFWKDFHKRVSSEMNRNETVTDRFNRWRLTHLPAALCQYSVLGLMKILVLVVMILLVFFVFHSGHKAQAVQETGNYHFEKDSSGMPLYQPIDVK